MTENLNERIGDLESKVAFQDDLLDTLNALVTQQSEQIARLEQAYKQLSTTVDSAGLGINTGDERPPHY
ncbi:SlyX protein [Litorivicinus lipolyticus]|jgi:SlyX protein|uniref:SlyX protein n=1 Tax=Litorivicinus lipolyticus TaxID=418701 RepID=A0A5Q2QCC9_9GAMM|nr:SlyX family protein [Litorivicinus lipolyticus]QGG79952.1 SlyX protein [Litorivicinus lipolyticus]